VEEAFPLPNHRRKLKLHSTDFSPLLVRGKKNPTEVRPRRRKMEQTISETVDKWIKEEQRPALLRVIRANDPWEGMSEEEIEDTKEYIRWYVSQDFKLLLLIPVHPRENEIWFSDYEEFRTSTFNTYDFERIQPPFDRYGYRVKKVPEKVKDLAILYSCLTSAEGREHTLGRYENLVNREFRDELMNLIDKYQMPEDRDEKMCLKPKIAKVSQRIMKCKEVWQKYSTWE
jgi:hypothetical protein